MSYSNVDFIFAWDDQEREYSKEISTYNDMILIIRNMYKEKFSEDTSIKVYFMDIDGESFEIQSQKEFLLVKDYFRNIIAEGKSLNVKKIKIKIIQQKFEISKLFLSSRMNLGESNLELNESKFFKSVLSQNKKSLDSDTDSIAAVISKELIEIKGLITSSHQEILKNFSAIIEQKFSKSEEKIESLTKEISLLKEKLENKEKDENEFNKKLEDTEISLGLNQVTKENMRGKQQNKIQVVNEKIVRNKKKIKDSEFFLYNEGESDVYICAICFVNTAKFACVICENLFLCKACEYSDSHSIHPRLSLSSIPHYSVENISKTIFSKNNFNTDFAINDNNLYQFDKKLFYFISNRNFFSKKSIDPVILEITLDMSLLEKKIDQKNILQLKMEEELKLPLKLKNLSNISIMPFELLITTKDSSPLRIENKLLNTKLKSYDSVNVDLLVNASSFPGEFKIELQLFHLMRKLEYNPVSIPINVSGI